MTNKDKIKGGGLWLELKLGEEVYLDVHSLHGLLDALEAHGPEWGLIKIQVVDTQGKRARLRFTAPDCFRISRLTKLQKDGLVPTEVNQNNL